MHIFLAGQKRSYDESFLKSNELQVTEEDETFYIATVEEQTGKKSRIILNSKCIYYEMSVLRKKFLDVKMEIIEEENCQDENFSQPKKSKNPFKKTYDEKYAESTKLSDTQRSRRFEDFFSLVKGFYYLNVLR